MLILDLVEDLPVRDVEHVTRFVILTEFVSESAIRVPLKENCKYRNKKKKKKASTHQDNKRA